MADLTDYYALLRQEIGLAQEDAVLLGALQSAVTKFNAETPTAIVLTGTALDRTPSAKEQRYLILCATYVYLTRRMIETSEQAVVVSNVAGKTDLTGIELALAKRRQEIADKEMPAILDELNSLAILGEVSADELGETLPFAGRTLTTAQLWPPWWP